MFERGHSIDVKRVDFADKLRFEGFKLSVVAEFAVALPVVELRQTLFQIRPRLLLGEALPCHVRHADAD